jgi:hypothetical protein
MNTQTKAPAENRLNDSSTKLAIAERVYVEKVLEIEALLTPYFSDTEVRRTIAESADPSRIAFKHFLACRQVVTGSPTELAMSILAECENQNASESPRKAQLLESNT